MSEQPVSATIVHGYLPEASPRRISVFDPPVYDTRFPWINWQQPVTLLQLGTLLRHYKCDVRLIDALHFKSDEDCYSSSPGARIFTRGDISINYWRYGHLQSRLILRLKLLKKESWQPVDVYIKGFTTFWWEGAVEAAKHDSSTLSSCTNHSFGAYPSLAANHALEHSKADILASSIEGTAGLPLDLSLYSSHPAFTYLSIGIDKRSSDEIIKELNSRDQSCKSARAYSAFCFRRSCYHW